MEGNRFKGGGVRTGCETWGGAGSNLFPLAARTSAWAWVLVEGSGDRGFLCKRVTWTKGNSPGPGLGELSSPSSYC